MSGKLKKVIILLLVVVCACNVRPLQVQAASKNYMKKINVKWDLKKNKTITFKTKYSELGMKKEKAKMTEYKVKDSKKKGYKELKFTVEFKTPWQITEDEVHKVCTSEDFEKYNTTGGSIACYLIDYETGKNLYAKNKYHVTVSNGGWIELNSRKTEDDDGCWMNFHTQRITFKVTYPKNYKGLCIGVGGSTEVVDTKNDTRFWNGKAAFGKTSYFSKKDKSIAHFMRVK